ncbi:MAG: hypothetical protein J7K00_00870 [Candidatus Diapherotrites archaeon]|nr:hypothetical protein [Candidatus Diapherotrites archaeon]
MPNNHFETIKAILITFVILIITINLTEVQSCGGGYNDNVCDSEDEESTSSGYYYCSDCLVTSAKVHYYYPDPVTYSNSICSDGSTSPCTAPAYLLPPPPCYDGSLPPCATGNQKAMEITHLSDGNSISTVNATSCNTTGTDNERECIFQEFFDCTYYGQYTAIIEFNHSTGSKHDKSTYIASTPGCSNECTTSYYTNPYVDNATSREYYTYANIGSGTEYYTSGSLGNFENNTPTNSETPERFVTYFCYPSGIGTTTATLKMSKHGKPAIDTEYITREDILTLNLNLNNSMDYSNLATGGTNVDAIRESTYVEFYLGDPCPDKTQPCSAPPKNDNTGRCDAGIEPPCLIDRTRIPYLADKDSTVQISVDWDTTNLHDNSFGQKELWVWIDAIDTAGNTGPVPGHEGQTTVAEPVGGEHADLDGHDGVSPQAIPSTSDPNSLHYSYVYSPDFSTNPAVNNQINFEQSNLRTKGLFEYGQETIITVKSKPNLRLFDPAAPSTANISVTCTGLLLKICELAAKIENNVSSVDADYTADAKNILVTFKINSEEPYNATPAPIDFKLLGTQTIDVPGTRGGNMPGETTTDTIYWIDFGTGFNLNVEANPDVSDVLGYLGRVVIETDYSDNTITKPQPP